MRGVLIGVGALVCGFVTACAAQAGVYNLDPPPSSYPRDIVQAAARNPATFRAQLGDLRAIDERAPRPGTLRAGYQRQVAHLEERKRDGTLTPADRVNLGACLVRLGRTNQAIAVLEEALRVVPPESGYRFLILANLASAYDVAQFPRAIDMQRMALKAWPKLWAGWGGAELAWYYRAETYALKLMHLRQNARGGPGTDETVDALFPGVRFVGPSGRYEAGTLSLEMNNLLPADADAVVRQLLLWRPQDDQLYWLYGELLNAQGDVESAYAVLDELRNGRKAARELDDHRRVLRAAREPFQVLLGSADPGGKPGLLTKPTVQEGLLWALAPRGQLMAPGMGPAVNEMGWAAAYTHAGQLEARAGAEDGAARLAAPTAPAGWLTDWRPFLVGFVAGALVALLGALQWWEWRRRLNGKRLVMMNEER